MTEILSMLGLGGMVGAVALAFIVPKLLPAAVVGAITAAMEGAATFLAWLLRHLAEGAQYISKSNSAVIALVFVGFLSAVMSRYTDTRERPSPRLSQVETPQRASKQVRAQKPKECSPLDIACRLGGYTW